MIMNSYERQLVNKWQLSMTKREAEEALYELREEQNGDPYEQLQPEHFAPGVKKELRREAARAAADEAAKAKAADPEHPVLRKYVPKEWGTDTSGLSKSEHQALRAELSEVYDVPSWILEITRLEQQETKIPEFKTRLSKPNHTAYDMLCRRKARRDGVRLLLGDELNSLVWDHCALAAYAKELQERR